MQNDKQVGVNKPHTQKSGFLEKPDLEGVKVGFEWGLRVGCMDVRVGFQQDLRVE